MPLHHRHARDFRSHHESDSLGAAAERPIPSCSAKARHRDRSAAAAACSERSRIRSSKSSLTSSCPAMSSSSTPTVWKPCFSRKMSRAARTPFSAPIGSSSSDSAAPRDRSRRNPSPDHAGTGSRLDPGRYHRHRHSHDRPSNRTHADYPNSAFPHPTRQRSPLEIGYRTAYSVLIAVVQNEGMPMQQIRFLAGLWIGVTVPFAMAVPLVAAEPTGVNIGDGGAIYQVEPGKALDLTDELTLEAWGAGGQDVRRRRAHPRQEFARHAGRLHARHAPGATPCDS